MAEVKVKSIRTNDIVKSMTKMRIVPGTGDIVKKKRVVSEEFRQKSSARLKEFAEKVNVYLETHPNTPRKEAMKIVSAEQKKLKEGTQKGEPKPTTPKLKVGIKKPFGKNTKKQSKLGLQEKEEEKIVYEDNIDNLSEEDETD